jgi:uncharacterized membrane protein
MDQTLAAPKIERQFPPLTQKPSYRIDAIDLLRGLVMIIMALDHTRDFFHKPAWTSDPLDLATTTPILYFTRWITHFCAPVFVFLAGTGAFFQSQRKTKKDLSLFLIKRGLWLLIVELVILNFAFTFDVHYSLIALQTIWSIGISMIILGLMVWLPFPVILATGAVIVLGHNLLDYYESGLKGASPGWLYSLVHQPGFYKLWDGHNLFILYPFLPWAGLMMLGYCFGKLFLKFEGAERKKILLWLGFGVIALFVLIRATDNYGDPGHWSKQKDGVFTFLSFMKVQKYPPSLLYMLATIGPAIIFLALAGNVRNRLTKFITVYGRVPFLYYILHFFLIHLVSAICFLSRGHSFQEGLKPNPPLIPQFAAPNEGYSLAMVYVIWLCIVISLYPVCKWFSEYKQKHREKWWLGYL